MEMTKFCCVSFHGGSKFPGLECPKASNEVTPLHAGDGECVDENIG